MKLLVVIVNYRVAHLTIDCLRSLEPEVRALPGVKVAVCENGTGDDSAARIAAAIEHEGWASWATLTAVHPNRGFTGGNNVILRAALVQPDRPEYFHLLNADTVVHPGALSALVSFMDDHPLVGIAGSRLENRDGSVQNSAFNFITAGTEFLSGLRLGLLARLRPRWVVAPPPPPEAAAVDWVSGASMIIRCEVFERIGLLEEDLYTYFDDVDICLRARRAGWPTWYVPASRVVHLVGQTTGFTNEPGRPKRRPAYWFQARRHYFLKNFGAWRTALADAGWIAGYATWRVRRIVQHKPDQDPPSLLWDSLRHSVVTTGFRLRPVKNPALQAEAAQPT